MNHIFRFAALALPAAVLLTGCMDDKYDLSDIDTTSELKVKDLTIPVNIDNVKLDEIITLSEGSKIKVYDGNYALLEGGDFESSPIEISEVKAKAPRLDDSSVSIVTNTSAAPRGAGSMTLNIKENHAPFSYSVSGVDDAIHSISSVETSPLKLSITVDMTALSAVVSNFIVEDLRIQFPKGMTATPSQGNYDPATGVLTVSRLNLSNGKVEISITTSKIDLLLNDAGIDTNHLFHFNSELSVIGGRVIINETGFDPSRLPSNLTFRTSYKLTDLEIKSISGTIEYGVKGMDITPIDLSGLPDFLNQDGTDIFLANPQIYLSLNNPLSEYALRYQAGLTITAVRPGQGDASYSLDDPFFTVGGASASTNLVFSPSTPGTPYPGFEGANHVGYASLSNVLSGERLPTSLRVTVTDPTVPLQNVKNFRLGTVIGAVKGKWQVMAPLALKPASSIVYSRLEDGWNDDDVDAIRITRLEISAKVTTDLPIGATLTGYPVDKYGNKLTDVEIVPVEIPAHADGKDIVIQVNGTIEHLDGFFFKVVARPDSETALSPDQMIRLDNIRARVSGSFIKKL